MLTSCPAPAPSCRMGMNWNKESSILAWEKVPG